MSVNYASGLSFYENKGKCGIPEIFDSDEEMNSKVSQLAQWMKKSKHCVLFCGAGISTSAGIPDFRGPNGVWTLEMKGERVDESKLSSFDKCVPTFSHQAIVALIKAGFVKFVVSQNIDGLFLKANIPRQNIAELHGNYFIDECNYCLKRFIRNSPSPTMACTLTGESCRRKPRPCRGALTDTILDWEQSLPDIELDFAEKHANKSDLSICLGTTLQINPAGLLPLRVLRQNRTRTKVPKVKNNKKLKREPIDDKCSIELKIENENEIKEIKDEKFAQNGDEIIKTELNDENIKSEDVDIDDKLNKLVIVNLQPTKYDKRSHLVLHQYIDAVMKRLCEILDVKVPQYDPENDPTKKHPHLTEWNF